MAFIFGVDDKTVYIAVLGTIMTAVVLAPMLNLSNNKSKRVKFFYGFIALVLFYVLGLILNSILVDHLEIFGEPWYKKYGQSFEFKDIIVVFKALPILLIAFLPANIAVILCFLLNDIYSNKIGKIISRFCRLACR